MEAWSRNDAAGVANSFTEDGVMILPGDVFKKGRDEIHSFMAAAYAGPFKGTGVTGRPVDVRIISDDAALIRTHGGILAAGQTEIAEEWPCAPPGSSSSGTASGSSPATRIARAAPARRRW